MEDVTTASRIRGAIGAGLSPFAFREENSRGRMRPEKESELRCAFQRDRDRIIHSKAFRRLMHKTQVFTPTTTARGSRTRWRSARSPALLHARSG